MKSGNKNRTYIVYYDHCNTSKNHAGMVHLVNLLNNNLTNIRLIKNISQDFIFSKYLAKAFAVALSFYFKIVIKKKDKVIFFEYLAKDTGYQVITAKLMRRLRINSDIYGLIHLSGKHLLELYNSTEVIKFNLKPIDKILVFGSTLTHFLKSTGFQNEIITTFHYVDIDFYRPSKKESNGGTLQVICMGNLKRNYDMLKSLVNKLPDIAFHILSGKKQLNYLFDGLENVKLYPFLPENEMLNLMQRCDVSVSVLEDTIGSNVITTSMASGLVNVVSDVGSIKDYCNNVDSFLCQSEEDFIHAIKLLDSDRILLENKKLASINKSMEFSHKVFIENFKKIS